MAGALAPVGAVLPGGATAGLAALQPQERWLEDEPSVRVFELRPTEPVGGILLVHDFFGVSDMTLAAAGRLADAGYHVVALDLYDGVSTTRQDSATALMNGLDPDRVRSKLERALRVLEGSSPVVAIGFSMGGAVAVQAATVSDRVSHAISVYGGGVEAVLTEAHAGERVLLVTGSADAWAMASARALLDLGAAVPVEIKIVPGAGHGYAQPLWAGGANLDVDATAETWAAIFAFLERAS